MKEMLNFMLSHPPPAPHQVSNKRLRRGYKNKQNLSLQLAAFPRFGQGNQCAESHAALKPVALRCVALFVCFLNPFKVLCVWEIKVVLVHVCVDGKENVKTRSLRHVYHKWICKTPNCCCPYLLLFSCMLFFKYRWVLLACWLFIQSCSLHSL